MPLEVRVRDLTPGMCLGEDLVGPRGTSLARRGLILTDGLIRSLALHGVETVRIRLDASEEPSETPEEKSLFEQVFKTKGNLGRFLEDLGGRAGFNERTFTALRKGVAGFVESVFDSRVEILRELRGLGDHDDTTLGHSVGVLFFSALLAREAEKLGWIRMDERARVSLGIGGSLHDLGKKLVPRAILVKPGALSEEEYRIMRSHPQLGYDRMRSSPAVPSMARSIVLHHHQRWDGTGYGPSSGIRLGGCLIPLMVRIVSVADVYDALIGDRPYRTGSIPAQALKIISAVAGTQLDPRLATLAARLVVPYPVGTVLLFRGGLVGTVVDCDAVGSSYRCYLTAACGEWGVPFLGRSIRIDRLDRMDAMVLEARKGTEALLPLLVTGEGGQRLYVLEAWENVFAAQADRALPPDRELLIRPVPPATGAGDGEAPLRPEDLP